jgi:hypothetical protein
VSEVDPDPAEHGKSGLGGSEVSAEGDPTDGGKHGEIGEVPSIRADEPDDGDTYPVRGAAADPGPGA